MTILGQHGKHHLYFHPVLAFAVLAVILTTALTAAGLSGDQPGKHTFEVRLASHEKVEGWEMAPGPGPEKTTVWISPEVALTNGDVKIARPDRSPAGKLRVAVFFTEEGAQKMARLTKSHIGEPLALILDGRVSMVKTIKGEISREAIIDNITEEEVVTIAVGLSGGKIKFEPWKPKFSTGKIKFEYRLASLASNEKVEGWELGLFPEPGYGLIFISPEVVLTNRDVARAYPAPDWKGGNKLYVEMLLTEEGALKMARWIKSHTGKYLVVILDGRVAGGFSFGNEYPGRAAIPGDFTEEEARLIAKGIMMK